MIRLTARLRAAYAAAFCAMALLAFAGVKSNVMQAAAATAPAGATCGMAMGAMATGGASSPDKPGKPGKAHAICDFCAAAAHAPAFGFAPPPVTAPSCVGYAFLAPGRSPGPRGPPAFQPRARGPPAVSG